MAKIVSSLKKSLHITSTHTLDPFKQYIKETKAAITSCKLLEYFTPHFSTKSGKLKLKSSVVALIKGKVRAGAEAKLASRRKIR